ncbi:hypothetical protein ACH4A8_06865 [Streptomyces vietnamensis]|uniref:hypothetical protein n=1 Tax=Streptomyces vietnamensis TaxID=362257 RepID=UPI0037A2B5CC
MAALNLLVGHALILLLRNTADPHARLAYAAAGTARRRWTRLPYAVRLLTRRADAPPPKTRTAPRPAVTLPRPRALSVLFHRAQPCAPYLPGSTPLHPALTHAGDFGVPSPTPECLLCLP